MQFSSIILTTLTLAATTLAAPAPVPVAAPAEAVAEMQAAASQPLIDMWENQDFLDIKFTGSAKVDECKEFPSKFNNVFQSGKAKKNFRCTVWVASDCKGTGFSFNAKPGANKFPSYIDKKATSWKCVDA